MMGQLQPRHIGSTHHGVGPTRSSGTREEPRWRARHCQGCERGVQQQCGSAAAQPRRSRQPCAALGQTVARVRQGTACGTERGQRV